MTTKAQELQLEKVKGDISEFLEISELGALSTVEELDECLTRVSEYSKAYRDILIDIRGSLGDVEFKRNYVDVGILTETLKTYTKDAKKVLRVVKIEEKEKLENRERDKLKADDELMEVGISTALETIELNSVEAANSLERFVSKMEVLLEEYFKLHGEIKGVFGAQYPISAKFDKTSHRVNEIIKQCEQNFFFFFMHFFSGTKHPREDNPNLYYWAEMTGLHTQTFNI